MLESTCYITIDNVVRGEKSNIYSNISPECVAQNSKSIRGDGPTNIKSGIVVAHNGYNNLLYKTKIETPDLISPNFEYKYSQCDGLDSIRGITRYYETSEIVLKACEISSPICYIPIDNSLPKNNIYKNVTADCLTQSFPISFDLGHFSLQSGVVVGVDPYGKIYKTQIKIPSSDSAQTYCYDYYPLLPEFSFFEISEAALEHCENSKVIELTTQKQNIGSVASAAFITCTIYTLFEYNELLDKIDAKAFSLAFLEDI
jgi:hypothetical protein